MSGSQQDEHEAIQHFLHWQEAERQHGWTSNDIKSDGFFVPNTATKAYLSDPRRVHNLFQAVFTEEDPAKYPDTKIIQEKYSKVFCILLCIGCARFINHFVRHNIDDQHLPLETKPKKFPQSTTQFWYKFFDKQWEFCAPVFEYNMDSDFDAIGYVLPIIHKEELRTGGSGASLYKITLHESYDRLHPDYRKRDGPAKPDSHVYVLKTYRTKDAEKYYRNEVDGFKRLRYNGPNGSPSSQIIGFYGNFVQRGTYNILLEYADIGTLEDYFKQTSPPSKPHDILAFWSGLLSGIFEGLKLIHMPGQGKSQEGPLFHGWHQDLKPANILVTSSIQHDEKSRSGISRHYRYSFKVADLGLSHFIKTVPSAEAADRDARGTRSYGAPECCRDTVTEESLLIVKQNVDVWSLGCVLSEAVVWAINGHQHVDEYRQQRSQKTEEIGGLDGADCFHNGFEVLDVVEQAHKSHLEYCRPKDCVTPKVVKLIEDGMLVDASGRLTATQLCFQAKKIIKDAKAELGVDPRDDVPEASQPNRHSGRSLPRKNTLANEELDHGAVPSQSKRSSLQRGQNSRAAVPERDDIQPRQSVSPNHFRYDDSSSTENSHLGSQDGNWPEDEETEVSRFKSNLTSNRGQRQSPPLPSAEPSFSDHSQTGYNVVQGKRPAHSPDPGLDYRGTLKSVTVSQAETIVPSIKSIPTTRVPGEPSPFPQAPPPGSSARRPSPSSHLPDLDPQSHQLGRQNLNSSGPDIIHRRSTLRSTTPFLSFEKAMEWKQNKKHNRFAVLPYSHLLSDLDNRDCAFLVDDAISMKPYWDDAKKCLELLGYIVKTTDKDGFEVYFTKNWTWPPNKPKKVNNSTKLVDEADKRILVGESNMKETLGRILDEYKGRLDKPSSSTSRLFGSKKSVKRLILYILTDGVWQDPCNIEEIIMEMIRTTGRLGLHNAQIGIQFIQFGNDPLGSDRLEYFDSQLKVTKDEDIVDNERFQGGNVLKMLLGSVNKMLDGDQQRNLNTAESAPSSSSQAPP